jgi:hypothetical protein
VFWYDNEYTDQDDDSPLFRLSSIVSVEFDNRMLEWVDLIIDVPVGRRME